MGEVTATLVSRTPAPDDKGKLLILVNLEYQMAYLFPPEQVFLDEEDPETDVKGYLVHVNRIGKQEIIPGHNWVFFSNKWEHGEI